MKEADIFESWINNLGEGTWSLPETPEQLDKLKTLMTKELIVGPDATNATEQLYDLIGDDELFDRLAELADRDPRANAWNDTEVMRRIKELGIEMPEPSAPGNPAEPQTGATAPVDAGTAPNPVPQQPVAEDQLDEFDMDTVTHAINALNPATGAAIGAVVGKGMEKAADWYQKRKEEKREKERQKAMNEGDNLATFEEINAMRKAAGLPMVEHRMLDESGETLNHILDRFKHEVKSFEETGELDEHLYDALFDYYLSAGEMPYGVAKARTGDPYNWISDQLGREIGVSENLIAPVAMPVATEGSACNMTAEGEYCPEHGLAECGMGMPAGIMDETLDKPPHDDAINYNGAITGSYYESKDGDALLARIKSLALLK